MGEFMDMKKMAAQIAVLRDKKAKQQQAHLLCSALIALLKGTK
jgi:hypothetical protein